MSEQHPIIAVTGPSGAGRTTITEAFEDIFRRNDINAFFVRGDSFRRYNHCDMQKAVREAEQHGRRLSHYGPEANCFDRLEALFREYAGTGNGEVREYIAYDPGQPDDACGVFTPWHPIEGHHDLLFYEGMHGGAISSSWTRRKERSTTHQPGYRSDRRKGDFENIDVAQYVDFLIGIVPVVNLEWIQKIHNDSLLRGYETDDVTQRIIDQLDDYINFIIPQYAYTDINIQRVPVVDTSSPFIARDIPASDESILVVHFRKPSDYDFPDIMRRIDNAFMSRANTLVIPDGNLRHALGVICTDRILELCRR